MQFAKPSEGSSGDKFSAAELEGNLCVFFDHEKDTYNGDWGPTEIAACGLIIALDTDDGPRVFENAWVFGAALAPTINRANGPVVGVIAKGTSSKGGNAPWILEDPTKTQMKAVEKWCAEFIEETPTGSVRYLGEEAPF